jgi:hypothetical protein
MVLPLRGGIMINYSYINFILLIRNITLCNKMSIFDFQLEDL